MNALAPWSSIHRDYKTVVDGRRLVLAWTPQGTALVPWVGPGQPKPDRDADGCRFSCAARRNPNAECVCAELDALGR